MEYPQERRKSVGRLACYRKNSDVVVQAFEEGRQAGKQSWSEVPVVTKVVSLVKKTAVPGNKSLWVNLFVTTTNKRNHESVEEIFDHRPCLLRALVTAGLSHCQERRLVAVSLNSLPRSPRGRHDLTF